MEERERRAYLHKAEEIIARLIEKRLAAGDPEELEEPEHPEDDADDEGELQKLQEMKALIAQAIAAQRESGVLPTPASVAIAVNKKIDPNRISPPVMTALALTLLQRLAQQQLER
jgi:hypothetical protein